MLAQIRVWGVNLGTLLTSGRLIAHPEPRKRSKTWFLPQDSTEGYTGRHPPCNSRGFWASFLEPFADSAAAASRPRNKFTLAAWETHSVQVPKDPEYILKGEVPGGLTGTGSSSWELLTQQLTVGTQVTKRPRAAAEDTGQDQKWGRVAAAQPGQAGNLRTLASVPFVFARAIVSITLSSLCNYMIKVCLPN